MKLYDMDRSGNSYKVRLLLALLGQDYDAIAINTREGETLTPEFKAINPRGQIPVLDDDGTIIWDSMAILVYLARKYQRNDLLPDDALPLARVMQWLAVSENELLYGLARARAFKLFNAPFDYQACSELGHAGLATVEQQLQQTSWLGGETFTLADIACYPYIALAHEGDIDISAYPAIQRWCKNLRALPNYIAMPGLENTPLD